ncbi:hypothetical protein [Deinococcus budaensis]|uniref:DUF4388 domain-containing protein n=1 Tax=Deinococcus budaensis TaxID=1665626 RepID=A0A7W8LQA3_9DEIO|nr:hypothetical protein [Deinococcus budaensis]MBB5234633.1 hypothetical protein [Deinococcus budaensis]
MALFGDLEHHALTDLAKVLRSQTGTLFFHEAYQSRTLELLLIRGHLRAAYLDGFPVQQPAQVRDILRELRAQGRGAFEFQKRDFPAAAPHFYDLRLAELLEASAELLVPPDQLPHPDTRFVPTAAALPVPASLEGAWSLLAPHLLAGASGAELAARVARPEAEVLATLHRLRAADLIAPQRAAAPVAAPLTAASPPPTPGMDGSAPAASAPLVQRLLGALRRLTGARA